MQNRCAHTGLPTYCCGHCNGTKAVEVEAFIGRKESEEPRFVKGRDKAEWRGLGERTDGGTGSPESIAAARVTLRGNPQTSWGKEQRLKSVQSMMGRLAGLLSQANVESLPDHASMPVIPEPDKRFKLRIGHPGQRSHVVKGGDEVERMDCDTKRSPAHKTTRAVPLRFNYETPRHARKQTQVTMPHSGLTPGFARRGFGKKAKG